MSPVTQSIYARTIHETPRAKKEIQELGDFSSNFGYIIGPVVAGIIADGFGTAAAFSALGIMGAAFALLLFLVMPEKAGMKGNA